MRGISVFLFFCIALASAVHVNILQNKVADKEFLAKQKAIFDLLYYVHQPSFYQDQVAVGDSYSVESNLDQYSDPQAVKWIIQKYKSHHLPKGRIFSVVYPSHAQEAKWLFKLFYYAKDYQTFYKTAAWARNHVNEHLFVYALSVAILHRPDTQGIILPPPYEIYPHYFFTNEIIQQAYHVKMQGHYDNISPYIQSGEGNSVVINGNYSGWYVHFDDEQKLSYFTEDVGLNSFYYYYHLDYPFWMNGEEFGLKKDRRGELFYYIHQQILARYYLERLSNGFGEIPDFSWDLIVKTGYYPSMRYRNGLSFPTRPNYFDLKQPGFLEHLIQVEDYESRIRNSIDLGYIYNKDGSHISLQKPEDIENVASIIESNDDLENVRYYRYPLQIAKMLLGNSAKPHNEYAVAPSALEHYQTSLRDPMFYQLFKRYVGFFTQFKNTLHPYSKEELYVPGVKIENVEVEKLITYFKQYESDISNVFYLNKDEVAKKSPNVHVKASQYRLNHKSFSVAVNVVSEKAVKVVFKLYLAPKYDSEGHYVHLNDNRLNFVELDQFIYDLKSGKNKIERNSKEFMWTIKDWSPSRQVYGDVVKSMAGSQSFYLDMSERHNGFPSRMVLPKGKKGGMPFVLFVMAAPYKAPVEPESSSSVHDFVVSSGIGSGLRALDSLPMGYPFDRPIEEGSFLYNNMHFKDVVIFHKKESDINIASQD